jgi:multidrug efflux pump subunit AcrB
MTSLTFILAVMPLAFAAKWIRYFYPNRCGFPAG